MTDMEILIRMFDRNNIEYESGGTDETGIAHLVIYAGYQGFMSIFSFNENGSLKAIEAYE